MNRVWVVLGLLGAGCLPLFVPSRGAWAHEDERPRPVQELFMPETWAGQWKLRFEHRRRETGALIATEEVTDVICPGDRLGLSAYVGRHGPRDRPDDGGEEAGMRATCTGAVKDRRLEVGCSSRLMLGACRLDVEVAVHARRRLDTLRGSGEWGVIGKTGECDGLPENASLGETIQVSGVRLGTDLGACSAPPASLVEKLPMQPELVFHLPTPIDDLAAEGAAGSVLLRWTPVPRAAAYKIYRALPGRPYRLHARRSAHAPPYRDHRVREGQTYRYVVRWVDVAGRESPVSSETSATPESGHEEVTR